MKAVVVGGGLAGLAAALDLVDAGHDVTLLESRPTLGGAVQTLPERADDPSPPPDNGQHVALGCCSAYLGFLARVGQAGAVRRTRLALPVIAEDGTSATIAPGAPPSASTAACCTRASIVSTTSVPTVRRWNNWSVNARIGSAERAPRRYSS